MRYVIAAGHKAPPYGGYEGIIQIIVRRDDLGVPWKVRSGWRDEVIPPYGIRGGFRAACRASGKGRPGVRPLREVIVVIGGGIAAGASPRPTGSYCGAGG